MLSKYLLNFWVILKNIRFKKNNLLGHSGKYFCCIYLKIWSHWLSFTKESRWSNIEDDIKVRVAFKFKWDSTLLLPWFLDPSQILHQKCMST